MRKKGNTVSLKKMEIKPRKINHDSLVYDCIYFIDGCVDILFLLSMKFYYIQCFATNLLINKYVENYFSHQ